MAFHRAGTEKGLKVEEGDVATLKGGGRILQHSHQVSNTYFHILLGGLKQIN